MTIKLGKYNIDGITTGNQQTGLIIQELKIQLDAGYYSGHDINHILITHGHSDHIKAITDIVQNNTKKTNIICPEFLLPFLKNFLNSFFQMVSLKKYNNKLNKLVTWNQDINNVIIETFPVKHSVKCVSYGIITKTKKLKEEFKGLSGPELVELKKTTEITETSFNHEILYVTDLDHTSLKSLPFLQYKNIIIECTFFFPEHKQEARDRFHLHWEDIQPIIKQFPDKNFLITHVSPRYLKQKETIKNIIKDFNNTQILI